MSSSAGARERLVSIVQRLERLEAAKQAASNELRAAFHAAAGAGYDPSTLKAVLRLRKLTPQERKERRALESIYLASLGMLEGDPLPDEARRRLDEQESPPPPKPPAGTQDRRAPQAAEKPVAPAPQPPPQLRMPVKDPDEARADGRAAAAAGKRIYDNPFPAGDPCRAAWDEGWCEKRKSHGMETPAAYQRRSKSPGPTDKSGADSEKKGGA